MKKTDICLVSPKEKCSRCSTKKALLGSFVFWHRDIGYEEYHICLECFKKVKEYLGLK